MSQLFTAYTYSKGKHYVTAERTQNKDELIADTWWPAIVYHDAQTPKLVHHVALASCSCGM